MGTCDVGSIVKIQGCLKTGDVVMGVGRPIVPFLKDFQAGENCLFLDYEGDGVSDLILIGIPIPMISFHFFRSLMTWSRFRQVTLSE